MNSGGVRSTATIAVFLTICFVLSRSSVAARPHITGFNVTNTRREDVVQHRNESGDDKRQRYIRSDSKAAFITQRLPDMKVPLPFHVVSIS